MENEIPQEQEAKNLKISNANWKWIMVTKLDLGYKTVDELVTKMKELFIETYKRKK